MKRVEEEQVAPLDETDALSIELSETRERAIELEKDNASLRGEPYVPTKTERALPTSLGATYRTKDRALEVEAELELAHERVLDLQIEAVILHETKARSRRSRFSKWLPLLPLLLFPLLVALAWLLTENIGLVLAAALFGALGTSLYLLLGRITPLDKSSQPPNRFF